MSVLATLVDDPKSFLASWPERPTVHDVDRDRLAVLFDRDAARQVVADPALCPIELGMVHRGAPSPLPPDADHPTHTLVLNGLHLSWPPLRDAVRRLAAELGHPVTANVYLTPPQSTGYGPHWDTHHVFLAQAEGAKTWRLHPPIVTDPLSRHRWTAVGFTTEQLDRVHDRAESVVLRAGQVLFIPRGWVHFGHTTAEHSLHVTFGVQLLTRHWLLQQLLDQAVEDPAVRAALPPDLSSYAVEDLVTRARSVLLAHLGRPDIPAAGRPVYLAQQRAVVAVGG
ncbi:JmjC domain-containing protein [Kitasatospora sp. NBC_01539]|uniref:JmjC domain-containing protein n=1 Tax=Kitasatospora sp. NBC_01539 TaxID=2903577 RepID=UPI0038600F3B